MLGIFAVLYILGLSIYKYATNTDPVDLPEYRADRWLEIFKVMPTICFSFEVSCIYYIHSSQYRQ